MIPSLALAEAWPVALDEAQRARAEAAGLAGRLRGMQFDSVIVEDNRFRPARECEDQRGAEIAFLFPARDAEGEIADVVAWWPETDRKATLIGEIGTLGLQVLAGPQMAPPLVYETISAWLADPNGLFILDPKLAAVDLQGRTLACPDRAAALRLHARFAPCVSKPLNIVVPKSNVRRAG